MTQPKYMNFTRYSQFAKMRRENPGLYWSNATQMAMHRLAEKCGEAFYETPIAQSQADTSTDTSSLTSPPTSDLDRQEKIAALKRHIEELELADIETTETESNAQ